MTTAQESVLAMLQNIQAHGYNPSANGLYINWRIDAQGNQETNFNGSGLPDEKSSPVRPLRHDALTDLRYLENMLIYKHVTGDTQFDGEIAKYTPLVQATNHAGEPRGWVYFDLADMSTYSGDAQWSQIGSQMVDHWAANLPPAQGGTPQPNQPLAPSDRTDWKVEIACAMIVEGQKRNDAALTQKGQTYLDDVWAANLDTQRDIIWSRGECKLGEVGQMIEALATAGQTAFAQALLNGVDPLVDKQYGGYFMKAVQSPWSVDTNKKEPGRSAEMLRAAFLAGAVDRAAQLLDVVLNKVYRPDLQGVYYESNPDFSPHSNKGSTTGVEDWVTTEAMGITIKALMIVGMAVTGQVPAPVPPPASTPPTTTPPSQPPQEKPPVSTTPTPDPIDTPVDTGTSTPTGQQDIPLDQHLASLIEHLMQALTHGKAIAQKTKQKVKSATQKAKQKVQQQKQKQKQSNTSSSNG